MDGKRPEEGCILDLQKANGMLAESSKEKKIDGKKISRGDRNPKREHAPYHYLQGGWGSRRRVVGKSTKKLGISPSAHSPQCRIIYGESGKTRAHVGALCTSREALPVQPANEKGSGGKEATRGSPPKG